MQEASGEMALEPPTFTFKIELNCVLVEGLGSIKIMRGSSKLFKSDQQK